MHDLRLALRQLAQSPGFSLVVVLTLALGIGANTAIFSFFHGILLSRLPYDDPDRLVLVKKAARDFGDVMGEGIGLQAADFRELQAQATKLSGLAAFTADVATLTGRGPPDLVFGAVVTPNYFSVLGARAAVGRTFTAADAADGARLLVLDHGYWQTNLGGDPAIVGQAITFNSVPFTIVGVMPADFSFPRWVKFWATPAGAVPENRIGAPPPTDGRGNYLRSVLGRLAPGVSREAAEQEMNAFVQRLPNPNANERAAFLVNMRDQTVGNVRSLLGLLLACVVLVLFIACLNVGNLMLSRATTRTRELGIRLALGAGRWRIVRQLLAESLVLALLGGAAGVALSWWGLDLLVGVATEEIPRLAAVQVNASVLVFALAVSLLTGIACGLAPVLGTATTELATSLKTADRGGSAGAAPRRLRAMLVSAEVAVSLVLLVAAGLLLRSFRELQSVSWGFNPAQVVSARVGFTDQRYATDEARIAFYRTLLDRLAAVPGFDAVGTNFDRIGQTWVHLSFVAEGHTYATPEDEPQASYHIVSPDYFETLGIPLLQGRAFTPHDDADSTPVVIVDAAIAQRYFPDGQALGKRIRTAFRAGGWSEIVGIVTNVKTNGPENTFRPDLYLPYPQATLPYLYIHVRTALDVVTAGAAIQRLVHEIDGDAPVVELASMQDVIAKPANDRRFPLGLLGVFAGVALVLATVGIYAVTAYGVTQRTREIGVRMALGARPGAVIALLVRQSLRPVGFGLGLGLIGAALTAFAMRRSLFGVQPLDPPTFVAIPLLLAAIAALASLLPARRATRVNPIEALRNE